MKSLDMSKRTSRLEPNTATLISFNNTAATTTTNIVVKAISGKKLVVAFPVKFEEFVTHLEQHFNFNRESIKLYTSLKQIIHLPKCYQDTSIANRSCYSYKELESLFVSYSYDDRSKEKEYRHSSCNNQEREDNIIWYVFGKPCIVENSEQHRMLTEKSSCQVDNNNNNNSSNSGSDIEAEHNHAKNSLCVSEYASEQEKIMLENRQRENNEYNMKNFNEKRTKIAKTKESKLNHHHHCDSKTDILPYPHNPTGLSQLCAIIKKFEERVVDQGYFHMHAQHTRDKAHANNDNDSNNYNYNSTDNDYISSIMSSYKKRIPITVHSRMLLASINTLYCEMCEHPTMQYMMAAIRNGDSVGDVNETQLYNLMSAVNESNLELFNWVEHNAELFVRMLNYDVIIAARQLFDERLNAKINNVYNHINLHVQRASLSHIASASSLLSTYSAHNSNNSRIIKDNNSKQKNNYNDNFGTNNNKLGKCEVNTTSLINTNINFDKSVHTYLNLEKKSNARKEIGSASYYHGSKRSVKNININNKKKIDDEQQTKEIIAVDSSNGENKNDSNIIDHSENVEDNRLQHEWKNCVVDNSDHRVNNLNIEDDQKNVKINNNKIINIYHNNRNITSEQDNNYIYINNNMPQCKLNEEEVISSANCKSDDSNCNNMLSNRHEQVLTDGKEHEEHPRKLPCLMCVLETEGVQLYPENLEEFNALWQNWVKVQTLIGSFLVNNTYTGSKTDIAEEERKGNNQENISALDNMLINFNNTLEHWWNTTYQTLCSSLATKPAKVSQSITTTKRLTVLSVSANVCVAEPSDNVKFALADGTAACVETKAAKANEELRWLTILVNLFCTLAEEFYLALCLTNNSAMTSDAVNDECNKEQKLDSNSCNVHVIDRMKSSQKSVFAQRACSYALHRSFVNECVEEIANTNRGTGKSTETVIPTYHLWRHLLSLHHDKNNTECAMETKQRIAMSSRLEVKQCQFTESADHEWHGNINCTNTDSNFCHKNWSDQSINNTILGRQEIPSNMAGGKNKETSLLSLSSSSSENTHVKMEEGEHEFPKERACIGIALFNDLWSYCLTSKSSLLWYSECDDVRQHEHFLTKDKKNKYIECVYSEFNSSCPLHIHNDRWSNSLSRQNSMFVYLLNGNDNTVEVHDLKLSEEPKSTRTCPMLLECAKRLLTQLCRQRELLTRTHSITSDNKSTRYCNKNEYSNTRIDKNEDINVVSTNINELPKEWNQLMIKCYSLLVQPIEHSLPRPNATSSPLYIVHTKEPCMFHFSRLMSRERSPITTEKNEESILHYFAGFIDLIHHTICLDKWCSTHLRVPWEILLMMKLQKCYTRKKQKIQAKVAALQSCSLDIGNTNFDKFRCSIKQTELTQEKEQNFYYVQYTQEQHEEQQQDMQQNTQHEYQREEKWKHTHQVTSDNSVKEENRPPYFQAKSFCNVFEWNVVTPNSITEATNRTCAYHKEHGTSTETSITSVKGNGKSVRNYNSNATKSVNQMHWPTISETRKSIHNFCSQEFEKEEQQHEEEKEEEEQVCHLTSKYPVQVGFIFHSELKQGKTCTEWEDEVVGTSKSGSSNHVNYNTKKLNENYIRCECSSESSSIQSSELLSTRPPIIQGGVLCPPSSRTAMNKPNKEAQHYLVQMHVINSECNVRNQPIFLSQYGCCSLGTSEKEINISSASRLIQHSNLSPDSGVFFYSTLYTELAKLIHQKRQERSVHSFPSLATVVRFAVIANIRKFNAPWLAVEHVLTSYGDAFCMPQLQREKTTNEKSTLLVSKKITDTLALTRSTTTTALQPNPPTECALLAHIVMPRNKKTLPRIAQVESVLPSNKSFVTTTFSSPRQDANVNGGGNEKGKETKERRTINIGDQSARPQREPNKNNDSSVNNINIYNDIKVSNICDNKQRKVDDTSINKVLSNSETGNITRKFNKIEVNAKYVEEHAVNDLYEAMLNHLLLTRPTGQLNVINSLISFVDAKMKAPVQLSTEQDKEKNAQLSVLQWQSIQDNVAGNIPQLGTVGKNQETTLSTPPPPPPTTKTATPIITANNENKLKVKHFNIHHFKK